MEEARSLGPRRVKSSYVPRRTSGEILAVAFQLVTEEKTPHPAETISVRPKRSRKRLETLAHREVMQ